MCERIYTLSGKILDRPDVQDKQAWANQNARMEDMRAELRKQIVSIEKKIDAATDRFVSIDSDITAKSLERKIESLEKERLHAQDRLQSGAKPKATPHQILELALTLLASPCKIWESGNLALQKLTLRLAFSEGLAYCRNEGFRTPKTTLPFKVLSDFDTSKCKMVPGGGFEPPTRGFSKLLSSPYKVAILRYVIESIDENKL